MIDRWAYQTARCPSVIIRQEACIDHIKYTQKTPHIHTHTLNMHRFPVCCSFKGRSLFASALFLKLDFNLNTGQFLREPFNKKMALKNFPKKHPCSHSRFCAAGKQTSACQQVKSHAGQVFNVYASGGIFVYTQQGSG